MNRVRDLDYDLLVALTSTADGRMSVSALATRIGWERSRASHHAKRVSTNGRKASWVGADAHRENELAWRMGADGRRYMVAARSATMCVRASV